MNFRFALRLQLLLVGLGLTFGARAQLPDVDTIVLPGSYDGHLQDVWYDGASLYWAHTEDIVRTDPQGNILAQVKVAGYHHAGLEVRDGRLYTAICLQNDMAVVGTKGNSHVIVGEYDAATLAPVAVHETAVQDRAGSLALLSDGTFLVGCLRQNDMAVDQVRYHHLDADFNLIRSFRVDGAPVQMGIEVLKVQGPFRYLCMVGSDAAGRNLGYDTVKVDADGREVWRGTVGGFWGLVVDGASIWTGQTFLDSKTGKWTSRLVRKYNDLPASVSVMPKLARGRVRACDVAFDPVDADRVLYLASGPAEGHSDTTNGWARVTRIANVPAGTTRVTNVVPSADGVVGRFFLGPAADADSRAYVPGMVAQWDGVENAGRGMHDASASYPVELVGGTVPTVTGTVPAGDRHFSLGCGDLKFEHAAIVEACNAGRATVEILATANAAPVDVFSLRVYGRALTRAEVEHNRRVDAQRFTGGSPFLASAPLCVRAVGASAYVQDGLLAQWDGLENAGWGVHDAGAPHPVELANGTVQTRTGTVPAGRDHFVLGNGYLTFSSPEIVAACNAGAATIEILMAPDGEPVHNGGLLAFGDTSRAFWIYERNYGGLRQLIGDATYHGAIGGDFQGINVPFDTAGTNLYAFVLGTNAWTQVRRDGDYVAALNRFKVDCKDAICRIGSLGGQWAGTRGCAKVFSIRVYGRVLSYAEREWNLAVDRMRFLLPVETRTVLVVR